MPTFSRSRSAVPAGPIPLLPSGPGGVFDLASPGADGCRAATAPHPRSGRSASQRGMTPRKCFLPSRNGGDPAGLPRHPHQSIPLLPSGPGGVFDLASRGADGATIDVRQLATLQTGGERGFTRRYAPRPTGGFAVQTATPSVEPVGVLTPSPMPPAKLTRHWTFATPCKLAERGGFEPPKRGLDAYTLSRRAPSTTRTPLRWTLAGVLAAFGAAILAPRHRPNKANDDEGAV